jgi:hypothetical protein
MTEIREQELSIYHGAGSRIRTDDLLITNSEHFKPSAKGRKPTLRHNHFLPNATPRQASVAEKRAKTLVRISNRNSLTPY